MAIFTQTILDTFQRADESPLNPVNWHSVSGLPTNDQLEIINNLATTTVQVQSDGQASYINDSLPVDQYVEVQAWQQTFDGEFNLYIRAGVDLSPSYNLVVAGQFGAVPPDPNLCSFLVQEIAVGGGDGYRWTSDLGIGLTLNSGDVISFGVSGGVGGHLYVYKNRVLISQFNLDDSVTNVPVPGSTGNSAQPIITSSGRAGLQLDSFIGASSDIGVKNFAAGSFSPGGGPALQTVIIGRFDGTSITNAFPQNDKKRLDLMQIINRGGKVVWNLDYQGTATINPTSFTRNDTILGQYLGDSWKSTFRDNNVNPYNFDLLQVVHPEGHVVWWLDYAGTVNKA